MQRRASWLILGHEVDYKSRLQQLQLLPLYMRRKIIDLVFLFKIIHGLVDIPGGFLSSKNTGHCLRNSDMTLMVPFACTDVFKFSYFANVTRLRNLLLYSIRSIQYLSCFLYFKLFPTAFDPLI